MKKIFALLMLMMPYVGLTAQPNVPLYVAWDGTVAAPTQFLAAVFHAGGGITITDNRTNLTISAAGGGASTTNFVLAMGQDLTNLIYSIGANTTNFTITTASALTNLIYTLGANETNFTIQTGTDLTNLIYQIGANSTNFTLGVSNYANSISNYAFQVWQSNSNYTDIAASNRVTVAQGTNAVVTTNGSGGVMTYTVSSVPTSTPFPGGTNRTVTIATNATSLTLDFLGQKDWYDCPTLMETNLVLSPTNLMAGREIWVFFTAANGNYDITVTNTAANDIRWNMNGATNGSTSFTVTNGQRAELCITVRTNNILHAVYGQYR